MSSIAGIPNWPGPSTVAVAASYVDRHIWIHRNGQIGVAKSTLLLMEMSVTSKRRRRLWRTFSKRFGQVWRSIPKMLGFPHGLKNRFFWGGGVFGCGWCDGPGESNTSLTTDSNCSGATRAVTKPLVICCFFSGIVHPPFYRDYFISHES